jgi:hypothetical protein
MDIKTVSIVFWVLSVAMLSVWTVESARNRRGTKSLLLCGVLMAGFGWALPQTM